MLPEEIRRYILKALYSDTWLDKHLVLKGGNALSLVYKVGNRNSLDLDFSIENDFKDIEKVHTRIKGALESVFIKIGLLVFDLKLIPKPEIVIDEWWGGYHIEFKIISKEKADKLSFKIDEMRKQSLPIDSQSQRRKYLIEISKFEYVAKKVNKVIDGINIYVYSPQLIAAEKLRALFQQHNSYPQIPKNAKRSRARDFYDIWAISDYFAIKLETQFPLVRDVFQAKRVNMGLLNRLHELKSLHKESWADVEISVQTKLENFDYYFDFVNSSALKLYAQWIKNSP